MNGMMLNLLAQATSAPTTAPAMVIDTSFGPVEFLVDMAYFLAAVLFVFGLKRDSNVS